MKMVEEYQLDLNSNEICRNCLARNCELKSLFRSDIIDGEIWPLPKVYTNVTSISVTKNDNYPKNLCGKCESALFEAFIFKQKAIKSHNLLRKVLKVSQDADEVDPYSLLLPSQQKSQAAQTNDAEEIEMSSVEENEETENNDTENNETENEEAETVDIKDDSTSVICAEEEPETDDNYQWVVVAENENDESTIEEDCTKTVDDIKDKAIETIHCGHCGEQVTHENLDRHSKQHAKILPNILISKEFFRCGRCLMVFPYIEYLQEHIDGEETCERSPELSKEDGCVDYQYLVDPPVCLFSTSKNADNTFSCNLCNLDFEDLLLLHKHSNRRHPSDLSSEYLRPELMHTCGICGSSLENLQDCLHHVYFHQSELACSQENCDHVSNSFSTLCDHFTVAHAAETFECSYCLYEAKDSIDLKQHQRKTCSARSFVCEICEKTFYKKSTLNMHIKTHTNDRRYACKMCPKAFLQRNDLLNHTRIHTLERPFLCHVCGKRFKTIGQKNGHLDTHTTENNYECDICQKTFKSARILRGHKKIHEERQFRCEVCDKKFNRKYHLTLHMKRHDKGHQKKKKNN